MTEARAYLDHNATAPLRPEARAALLAALGVPGNPSSVHADGRRARGIIEEARRDVAALVGAEPAGVVFTSGGTEAVNLALNGGYDVIALAGIEHACVREAATGQSAGLREIAVDANGLIPEVALIEALAGCAGQRVLVCLQMANNETGVIQSVAALARVAKAHGADVFCDAVQAVGRVPIDIAALGVDALAISAHKLGGVAGAGALVVRPGFEVCALVRGGGQERGRRGGSENVAGIVAFGAAARAAKAGLTDAHGIAAMRDRLEAEVLRSRGGAVVIGRGVPRLANTSAIIGPVKAETLVIRMDLAGVSISAGAACSSGKVGRSATLAAMGLADDVASRVIRVSLGWTSTERDIEAFLAVWRATVGDADETSSGPGGADGATRAFVELMGV